MDEDITVPNGNIGRHTPPLNLANMSEKTPQRRPSPTQLQQQAAARPDLTNQDIGALYNILRRYGGALNKAQSILNLLLDTVTKKYLLIDITVKYRNKLEAEANKKIMLGLDKIENPVARDIQAQLILREQVDDYVLFPRLRAGKNGQGDIITGLWLAELLYDESQVTPECRYSSSEKRNLWEKLMQGHYEGFDNRTLLMANLGVVNDNSRQTKTIGEQGYQRTVKSWVHMYCDVTLGKIHESMYPSDEKPPTPRVLDAKRVCPMLFSEQEQHAIELLHHISNLYAVANQLVALINQGYILMRKAVPDRSVQSDDKLQTKELSPNLGGAAFFPNGDSVGPSKPQHSSEALDPDALDKLGMHFASLVDYILPRFLQRFKEVKVTLKTDQEKYAEIWNITDNDFSALMIWFDSLFTSTRIMSSALQHVLEPYPLAQIVNDAAFADDLQLFECYCNSPIWVEQAQRSSRSATVALNPDIDDELKTNVFKIYMSTILLRDHTFNNKAHLIAFARHLAEWANMDSCLIDQVVELLDNPDNKGIIRALEKELDIAIIPPSSAGVENGNKHSAALHG